MEDARPFAVIAEFGTAIKLRSLRKLFLGLFDRRNRAAVATLAHDPPHAVAGEEALGFFLCVGGDGARGDKNERLSQVLRGLEVLAVELDRPSSRLRVYEV